jgi:predicted lipid-binding transport protein (Tim44 family)
MTHRLTRDTHTFDKESPMKTLIALFFSLLAVTLVTAPDAEAKRLGGGSSLGRQTTAPRQIDAPRPTPTPAQAPRPAPASPAATGPSRWLGPLAGLAAGGLLASLFFGGAFEGMTALDWLLIAALAFGVVQLLRTMRRRAPAPAAATPGGRVPLGAAPLGGLGSGAAHASAPVTRNDAPAWFDARGFAHGAKDHFVRLQAAWDAADWQAIGEYVTPSLLAELQAEHARSAVPGQRTEVVSLDVRLLEMQRDGDRVLASVRFSGLLREEAGGDAERFDEVWHVEHDWASRDGDWLIAGIQQVG